MNTYSNTYRIAPFTSPDLLTWLGILTACSNSCNTTCSTESDRCCASCKRYCANSGGRFKAKFTFWLLLGDKVHRDVSSTTIALPTHTTHRTIAYPKVDRFLIILNPIALPSSTPIKTTAHDQFSRSRLGIRR